MSLTWEFLDNDGKTWKLYKHQDQQKLTENRAKYGDFFGPVQLSFSQKQYHFNCQECTQTPTDSKIPRKIRIRTVEHASPPAPKGYTAIHADPSPSSPAKPGQCRKCKDSGQFWSETGSIGPGYYACDACAPAAVAKKEQEKEDEKNADTWKWEFEDNGSWREYARPDVAKLVRAFNEHVAKPPPETYNYDLITLTMSNGFVYKFDFVTLKQINPQTHTTRTIRRMRKTPGMPKAAVPPPAKVKAHPPGYQLNNPFIYEGRNGQGTWYPITLLDYAGSDAFKVNVKDGTPHGTTWDALHIAHIRACDGSIAPKDGTSQAEWTKPVGMKTPASDISLTPVPSTGSLGTLHTALAHTSSHGTLVSKLSTNYSVAEEKGKWKKQRPDGSWERFHSDVELVLDTRIKEKVQKCNIWVDGKEYSFDFSTFVMQSTKNTAETCRFQKQIPATWLFRDGPGWKPYSSTDAEILETRFEQSKIPAKSEQRVAHVKFSFDNYRQEYLIDFNLMSQRNTTSGMVRDIRREGGGAASP